MTAQPSSTCSAVTLRAGSRRTTVPWVALSNTPFCMHLPTAGVEGIDIEGAEEVVPHKLAIGGAKTAEFVNLDLI